MSSRSDLVLLAAFLAAALPLGLGKKCKNLTRYISILPTYLTGDSLAGASSVSSAASTAAFFPRLALVSLTGEAALASVLEAAAFLPLLGLTSSSSTTASFSGSTVLAAAGFLPLFATGLGSSSFSAESSSTTFLGRPRRLEGVSTLA